MLGGLLPQVSKCKLLCSYSPWLVIITGWWCVAGDIVCRWFVVVVWMLVRRRRCVLDTLGEAGVSWFLWSGVPSWYIWRF